MASWNQLMSLLANLGRPTSAPPAPTAPNTPWTQSAAERFNLGLPPALPELGNLLGVTHTQPQYNDLLRWMQYGSTPMPVRPFGPGEYVGRSTGGVSSEETKTIGVDAQGNAVADKDAVKWVVVPGLWLVNGQPTNVNEDMAAQYAKQSGLNWPSFPSQQAADHWAQYGREAQLEQVRGDTSKLPPLWSRPK